MPSKTKKEGKPKGGKQEKKQKQPVVDAGQQPGPRGGDGVREALYWPDGSNKENVNNGAQNAGGEGADNQVGLPKFVPGKNELGKPKNRGYVIPDAQYQEKADDGTVIEAMRGWPHYKAEQEQKERQREEDERLMREAMEQEARKKARKAAMQKKKNKGKDGKDGKDDKKKDEEEEDPNDPYIGDLISHRYLYERRLAEQEAAEAAEKAYMEEHGIAPESARSFTDIRMNKTAQLRAIHLSQKVEVNPKDLWQMPKFKNSARPQLETFRKGYSKGQGGQGQGQRQGQANGYGGGHGSGEIPVCTCLDHA